MDKIISDLNNFELAIRHFNEPSLEHLKENLEQQIQRTKKLGLSEESRIKQANIHARKVSIINSLLRKKRAPIYY